ncbi:DnaB-like helicase C-terminal domain-containing protein, partial [Staphylococcus aureus]|uniref:DnaB-like helicase C-terminal domain-containing protein n=1 Tax=Staphylococcus aureus TaxID=1280 RepID=UPI0020C0D55E
ELPDLAADELKAIIEEAKDEFAVIGANEKNRDFYVNEFFEMTRQRMTDEVVNDYMLEKITREELAQRVSEIEMIGAIKKTSESQWLDEAVDKKTTEILKGKQDLLFALTGYRELDNLSKLATGTLNVLAARPSVGKTAFVLNLARNFANIGGATLDFFSGETKTESLMNRIFAMETRIEARKYRELDLSEQEYERTMSMSADIAKRNMCITEMTNKNVYEIRKRVQQSKLERPAA